MKLFTRAIVLTLIMASALTARAQEKLYAVVDYMHLPEGRSHQEYIALEKLWQRLHQKAVDAGHCRGWHLNRVENGGRHQYVTIQVYDSLDKFANRWPDSLREGLYNSEETETMRRTGQLRDLAHREIWQLEAAAMKSGDEDAAPMLVHFMKPKPAKYGEYYSMERNQYQKIHQARVDAGQMKSWFFLSRLSPGGSDGEFDFVTLNSYPAKGPQWDPSIAQAALTKEEWDTLPNPSVVRTMVREEVWYPITRTSAPKQQLSSAVK